VAPGLKFDLVAPTLEGASLGYEVSSRPPDSAVAALEEHPELADSRHEIAGLIPSQRGQRDDRHDAPLPADMPSGTSAIVPTAIAVALPPTTLLITATRVGAREVRLPGRMPDAHVGEHPERVVVGRHHEQVGLAPRHLEVVVPDAVDRPPVLEVLGDALNEAQEDEQAKHVERGQRNERAYLEGIADRRDLADETSATRVLETENR
jgi:hypothetical protein